MLSTDFHNKRRSYYTIINKQNYKNKIHTNKIFFCVIVVNKLIYERYNIMIYLHLLIA